MKNFIALLMTISTATLHATGFYIGTYTTGSQSKGIYHAQLDDATGAISDVQLASDAANPSYLAISPDGKYVYAALEDAEPAVAAFRAEDGGKLTALGRQPSGGADPCHVSLDRTGRFLFVANYTGGSIASFAINPDGSLGQRVSFLQFPGGGTDDRGEQQKPHAHGIYPSFDNRFVYACDLGTDKVYVLAFDAGTGKLTELGFGSVPEGAGPRHLVFALNGRFAYVANELGLSVTSFRVDPKTGALDPIETLPVHDTPPDVHASLAEISLARGGRWLYVSSRGDNTIAVYSVAEDGKLDRVENMTAGVKVPRGFAMAPSGKWLVVAGQGDDCITSLARDSGTGKLKPASTEASVGKPVCIVFQK